MTIRVSRAMLLVIFLLGACTPITTPPPPDATAIPTQVLQPTTTPTPTEQAVLPYNPAEIAVWEYWLPEDVKGMDPWGDSGDKTMDIIAIYEKDGTDFLSFRLDFMDLETDELSPTYFALDFASGGSDLLDPGSPSTFDITWDLMVVISGSEFSLYDAAFKPQTEFLDYTQIDRTLDFIVFTIERQAFVAWQGDPFQMQSLVTDGSGTIIHDKTEPTLSNASTGKGKLVLYSNGNSIGYNPDGISWYDGYRLLSDKRPGERRGFRYILDALDTYKLPLTYANSVDLVTADEFLGIHDRLRKLAGQDQLDLLVTPSYGIFMNWQPEDVNRKAIDISMEQHQDMGLPISKIFYPYEGKITPENIQTIENAGFQAIWANSEYRFWFGEIEDWSNPTAVKADIESLRKVHLINGMQFLFHNTAINYHGFYVDERWEEVDWENWTEYEAYIGTDQGLYLWWRRALHDMAMDEDQEQFFTIGTDLMSTPWLFPDVVDWNYKWIVSHPWIEPTTLSSILERGWMPIDHGNLPLAPDELLQQYELAGNLDYNAYFPWFYYGGISDGHSPLIPAGVEIEAYYDYMPYLRDSQPIPSGRIMGDDQTPASIIYETLANLRAGPDNDLLTLAWIAFLTSIGEQTFHSTEFFAGDEQDPGVPWGGRYLHPEIRFRANKVMQVNKIVAAAQWADQTAKGLIPKASQAVARDVDLDGEDEFILSNDKVFTIFENDGARLEYAFAYGPGVGPVQLIAPVYQLGQGIHPVGSNYEMGEVGDLLSESWQTDAAFVDDLDLDGKLDYPVFDATIEKSGLVFSLPEGNVVKTFQLEDDTIHARYALQGGESKNTNFGFVTNLLQMYQQGWYQSWKIIEADNWAGMQTSDGGQVLVKDVTDEDVVSFLQSPARQDQQERDDYNTYPAGHHFPYPFSTIMCWNRSEFSLRLSADVERRK